MDIIDILELAKKGELEGCKGCPWSPNENSDIGFGTSCTEHGFDWEKGGKVNSMYIAQDPGDTTPNKTGRLCWVHNAKNPTDNTAQQGLKLWNTAVSLDYDNPENGGYLKHNYWTNAAMHGAGNMSNTKDLKKYLNKVTKSYCSNILKLQILALKPRVIIASGRMAVNGLYQIGALERDWDFIRYSFIEGAYQETISEWNNLPAFTVFCTYHSSINTTNRTLPSLYKPEVEEKLKSKISKLESKESVERFLEEYQSNNTTAKGMRYLLNHWLDIGAKIRYEFQQL